jgi:glutathione S-transferase
MSDTIRIFGDSRSGNCYKLQMLCAELDLPYQWQEVDILAGATRTPEFLAMNPNGRIPLLVTTGGEYLPESNAILSYLADGSELAGNSAWTRALVLSWMFFEQYSHEPNIATSRFIIKYLGNPPERRKSLDEKKGPGYKALDVMEQQLSKTAFMAGETFSLADIALYAYTHVAHEGGFDLDNYAAINAWLERIAARPRYVGMRSPRPSN